MNSPDTLATLWQDQPTGRTPDATSLAAAVRQRHRAFARSLRWRDLREALAAIFVAVVFYLMTRGDPYPVRAAGWMAVYAGVGVALFFLYERVRVFWIHARRDDTVLAEVRHARAELQRQAWLLRHVGWWYLLPLGAPVVALFLAVAWTIALPPFLTPLLAFPLLAFEYAVCHYIYRLNLRVLHDEVEPRQRELDELLAALEAEEAPTAEA